MKLKTRTSIVARNCRYNFHQIHFIKYQSYKGNSNFELGTAICYVNVENYFLTIIKHIAVPSSKLEFPFWALNW